MDLYMKMNFKVVSQFGDDLILNQIQIIFIESTSILFYNY